jgi:hypothetical protein
MNSLINDRRILKIKATQIVNLSPGNLNIKSPVNKNSRQIACRLKIYSNLLIKLNKILKKLQIKQHLLLQE